MAAGFPQSASDVLGCSVRDEKKYETIEMVAMRRRVVLAVAIGAAFTGWTALAGSPGDVSDAVVRGERWLVSQQTATGA